MAFIYPIDPATGIKLPNWIPGYWANNARWLHAMATQNWDTFTGSSFVWNETQGLGEKDCWRGWMVYAGVNTLLTDIVSTGGMGKKLYITDNVREHLMGAISSSMDISVDGASAAMAYTAGKRYRVRVSQGLSSAGSCSCTTYRLAILTPNAYAPWPTLPAFADGSVPTAADFAKVSTAEKYLNTMLTPVGSSCYVSLSGDGSGVAGAGSWFIRGLGASFQRTVTLVSRFSNSTVTISFYDASNVLQDSFSLPVGSTAEQTQSLTLTGTYTAGTFGRIVVNCASTQTAYIRKITVGGGIALNHPVPAMASLVEVRGNSGANQMYILGNENLSDIRAILRPGSDNGFQFLIPDQTLGQPISANAPFIGPSSERDATYNLLYYLPTGIGATGSALYGKKTLSLPDVNNGDWAAYDLSTVPDLAAGMSLRVDGVKACYQG